MHTPVFRVGGDEFAVILLGEDFDKQESLKRKLNKEQKEISASAENKWEAVSVSFGIAVYDPEVDYSMKDLIRRADQLMYQDKHIRKKQK